MDGHYSRWGAYQFFAGIRRPTRYPLSGTSGLRCRNLLLFLLLLLGIVAGYQAHLYKQQNPGVGVRENIDIWARRPDKLNNRLTPLRGKPQIQFRQNWPRIDGATAAYPIYASAFYALSVIPEDFHVWDYLENSRTPEAYNKIVKGDADIIFVAQPSGGQKTCKGIWCHFAVHPLPVKHSFSSSMRIIRLIP